MPQKSTVSFITFTLNHKTIR